MTDKIRKALEVAREINGKATAGPWDAEWYGPFGSEDGPWVHHAFGPEHEHDEDGDHEMAEAKAKDDSALIASLRNTNAAALAVIEAAHTLRANYGGEAREQDLDRIEEVLDAWADAVLGEGE